MQNNIIGVFDLETGSTRKSDTQIIQIAFCAIDPRNLSIVQGSEFETMVRALDPDALQDEALAINKKTRAEIAAAPHPEEAWHNFARWVSQYNLKGRNDPYSAPIPAGHNIIGFDLPIYERYCLEYKTVRKQKNGEWQGTIFNGFLRYDTMQMLGSWWESLVEPNKLSLDYCRRYFDMPAGDRETHDALQDVRDTAKILIKILELQRRYAKKTIWKDAFNPEKVAAEVERRKSLSKKGDRN